jgi:hypothetical protein
MQNKPRTTPTSDLHMPREGLIVSVRQDHRVYIGSPIRISTTGPMPSTCYSSYSPRAWRKVPYLKLGKIDTINLRCHEEMDVAIGNRSPGPLDLTRDNPFLSATVPPGYIPTAPRSSMLKAYLPALMERARRFGMDIDGFSNIRGNRTSPENGLYWTDEEGYLHVYWSSVKLTLGVGGNGGVGYRPGIG